MTHFEGYKSYSLLLLLLGLSGCPEFEILQTVSVGKEAHDKSRGSLYRAALRNVSRSHFVLVGGSKQKQQTNSSACTITSFQHKMYGNFSNNHFARAIPGYISCFLTIFFLLLVFLLFLPYIMVDRYFPKSPLLGAFQITAVSHGPLEWVQVFALWIEGICFNKELNLNHTNTILYQLGRKEHGICDYHLDYRLRFNIMKIESLFLLF